MRTLTASCVSAHLSLFCSPSGHWCLSSSASGFSRDSLHFNESCGRHIISVQGRYSNRGAGSEKGYLSAVGLQSTSSTRTKFQILYYYLSLFSFLCTLPIMYTFMCCTDHLFRMMVFIPLALGSVGCKGTTAQCPSENDPGPERSCHNPPQGQAPSNDWSTVEVQRPHFPP